MNWFPYVSRDFLASAEARCKAEHDNAQSLRHALVREESRSDHERAERIAERDASERRYQDLLSRFTMLRLQGAQEAAASPSGAIAPREVDLCKDAINAKFTGNRAPLRAAALRQLAADRAAGKDDTAILAEIESGQVSEAPV